MEKLLDDRVLRQLDEAFAQLKEPVRIFLFTSGEPCETCEITRQLLNEVVATHNQLSLSVHNMQTDTELALQFHVDKAPAIVIAARDGEQISNLGVQFSGVPSGHEFATLINDILLVSNRDSGLSPAVREFLKNLNQPLLLQVFVTPT